MEGWKEQAGVGKAKGVCVAGVEEEWGIERRLEKSLKHQIFEALVDYK